MSRCLMTRDLVTRISKVIDLSIHSAPSAGSGHDPVTCDPVTPRVTYLTVHAALGLLQSLPELDQVDAQVTLVPLNLPTEVIR